MIDILGRAIHDGDIVVAKGNAYNGGFDGKQKGMEVGVALGNTIHTLTCKRNPRDLFLVVNPSKSELEIKEQILAARKEKLENTKKRAKEKKALKADEIGAIYITTKYKQAFLYLGTRKIESYADGTLVETKEGRVYIGLDTWVKNPDKYKNLSLKHLVDNHKMYSFDGSIPYDFEFIKGFKTVESKIGECIDLKDEFIIERECTCTINGVKPYEKLLIKVMKP